MDSLDDLRIPDSIKHIPLMLRRSCGKIIDVTDALCKSLGLSAEQVIGKNSFSLCDRSEDAARLKERPPLCSSPEHFRYKGKMICAHYMCVTKNHALVLINPTCPRLSSCRRSSRTQQDPCEESDTSP